MSTPDAVTVRPSVLSGSRPAIIVLPGGGYEEHGRASSEPMADWFAGIGVHAFLFRYPLRTPDTSGPLHPTPIEATRRVFDWLRAGAPGAGVTVDTGRVGVVGSSAGGHLAASLANGIDDPALDRPDFCVLNYPVISMESPTRPRPVVGLLGDAPTWRERRALSMETRVDARTPPTFVWTTGSSGRPTHWRTPTPSSGTRSTSRCTSSRTAGTASGPRCASRTRRSGRGSARTGCGTSAC